MIIRFRYYCCGMDHFQNCGLSRGMRRGVGLVVLPRGADDAGHTATRTKAADRQVKAALAAKAKRVSDPKRRIVGCEQCPPPLSSTLIRKHLSSSRGAAVKAKAKGAAAPGGLHEWLPEGVIEVMMRGEEEA